MEWMSVAQMQELLAKASVALEKPLEEVLGEFVPDEDMKKLLAPYMNEWGARPLHKFLGYINDGDKVPPENPITDLVNCSMFPVNVFRIFSGFYYD